MSDPQFSIDPVRPWDLFTLTRMAYANMTGVDREFTRSTSGPVAHALGYVILPLYLLTSGRGYKATAQGEIVGCAFLNMRRLTGFVFNVNVNETFRRKGIGRALMEHVEREVRRLGRRWVGLHLDDGNRPAQRLYESLGYRHYHHRLLRCTNPGLLPITQSSDVVAARMNRIEGQRLWQQYADLARREGDAWAARLIREDFDEGPPQSGEFWQCRVQDEEAGSIWVGGSITAPIVRFVLRREYWSDEAVLFSLLGSVIQLPTAAINSLDLHFGSSEHHDAIVPHLHKYSVVPVNRPRILMLKELL